jgi:4-hydroxybenzoate polyprenyltransferase
MRSIGRALRIHQWAKNLLVFVAFLAGHKFADRVAFQKAFLAFLAFGCGASALYVVNDLVDLEHDRHHTTKRWRPFAAGSLPLGLGLVLVPALLALAVGVALAISWPFVGMLCLYLVSSLLYSFALKDQMILDVMVLALLYTLRVLAGGTATDTPISNWLLIFSIFLFLSLALVKRVTELRGMQLAGRTEPIPGRGYGPEDLGPLASLGAASGYIAVVVFALYLSSADVTRLYHRPNLLWIACPLLIYWVSRVWLLAQRGNLHEDPLVFAIRDPASWIVGALAAAVVAAAL